LCLGYYLLLETVSYRIVEYHTASKSLICNLNFHYFLDSNHINNKKMATNGKKSRKKANETALV